MKYSMIALASVLLAPVALSAGDTEITLTCSTTAVRQCTRPVSNEERRCGEWRALPSDDTFQLLRRSDGWYVSTGKRTTRLTDVGTDDRVLRVREPEDAESPDLALVYIVDRSNLKMLRTLISSTESYDFGGRCSNKSKF